MKKIFGNSTTDKLYNYAITLGFTAEAAAAIAATIFVEGAGDEIIPLRGQRQIDYMLFAENNKKDHTSPDTKIQYIFRELASDGDRNYSALKGSTTVSSAIRIFHKEYLGVELPDSEVINIAIIANEINTLFVGR